MKAIIGKIVDANASYHRMLVDNDSIIALDDDNALPDGTEIVKLSPDEMLIPSLADCHVHFFQTGLFLNALDLSAVHTKSELLSFLRWTPIEKYRIGEIIWGWSFEPQDEMPTASDLQSAAPNKPILISRVDGHSLSLSFDAQKMIPQNLRNETGIYRGKSQEQIIKLFLSQATESDLVSAAHRVSETALDAGVTLIHALVPDVFWAELLLKIQHELPITIEIFIETTDVHKVKDLGLKQIGGCLLLDGSFGSHTAAISQPYNDKPDDNGILYYSDDDLEKFFETALQENISVAMHAIGDRAIEQYVRVAERTACGAKLERWRIEHSELMTQSLLERIAKLGLTLSIQPAFEARWGGPNKLYAQRLGELWKNTNPFETEIEMGILLLGGSDAYITPIDPLGGIFSAMNHPNFDQRLDFRQALSLFSTNAGKWAGSDFGEFKIGNKAKGIIISGDFTNSKPAIAGRV